MTVGIPMALVALLLFNLQSFLGGNEVNIVLCPSYTAQCKERDEG